MINIHSERCLSNLVLDFLTKAQVEVGDIINRLFSALGRHSHLDRRRLDCLHHVRLGSYWFQTINS